MAVGQMLWAMGRGGEVGGVRAAVEKQRKVAKYARSNLLLFTYFSCFDDCVCPLCCATRVRVRTQSVGRRLSVVRSVET